MANCLTTLRAIARLHNQTAAGTEFESKKQLVSVSTPRLVFFGIAQSFRLTLAAALCYGGSYFIAHTIGLGDLILNCVALEVRRILPALVVSCTNHCSFTCGKRCSLVLSVCDGDRRVAFRRLCPAKAEGCSMQGGKARDALLAQVPWHGLVPGA